MPPLALIVCALVIDMRLWIGFAFAFVFASALRLRVDSLALPTKVTARLTNATCAEAEMPVASQQLPVTSYQLRADADA